MSPFQCHIYGQEYILTLADWQNFRPSYDPLRCAQERLPCYCLQSWIWETIVTPLQVFGYGMASAGLVYYGVGYEGIHTYYTVSQTYAKKLWDEQPETSLAPRTIQLRKALVLSMYVTILVLLVAGTAMRTGRRLVVYIAFERRVGMSLQSNITCYPERQIAGACYSPLYNIFLHSACFHTCLFYGFCFSPNQSSSMSDLQQLWLRESHSLIISLFIQSHVSSSSSPPPLLFTRF